MYVSLYAVHRFNIADLSARFGTIFRRQKNRMRFATFLRMARDKLRRNRERKREGVGGCATGNANEKREQAEDRTYSLAVITCTVSYSPRGDTHSHSHSTNFLSPSSGETGSL